MGVLFSGERGTAGGAGSSLRRKADAGARTQLHGRRRGARGAGPGGEGRGRTSQVEPGWTATPGVSVVTPSPVPKRASSWPCSLCPADPSSLTGSVGRWCRTPTPKGRLLVGLGHSTTCGTEPSSWTATAGGHTRITPSRSCLPVRPVAAWLVGIGAGIAKGGLDLGCWGWLDDRGAVTATARTRGGRMERGADVLVVGAGVLGRPVAFALASAAPTARVVLAVIPTGRALRGPPGRCSASWER